MAATALISRMMTSSNYGLSHKHFVILADKIDAIAWPDDREGVWNE